MRDAIVSAPEPKHTLNNLTGCVVVFDLRRKGGTVTREKGEVTAQQWLGLTQRGGIPEYQLTIVGKTGRQVIARLTEDHVQPV